LRSLRSPNSSPQGSSTVIFAGCAPRTGDAASSRRWSSRAASRRNDRRRAAGLFLSVRLPEGTDEAALLESARARGIAVEGINEHTFEPQQPGLAVGFAALPEPTLRRAIRELSRV
jgi:hypothetical protein